MTASPSLWQQGNVWVEDVERYEVIDGVHVEREPMGAFETVLASWLCHLINACVVERRLGLAVNEVLFVLNASRDLKRRPDVAFVSYIYPLAHNRCRARTRLECRARFSDRDCEPHESCRGD